MDVQYSGSAAVVVLCVLSFIMGIFVSGVIAYIASEIRWWKKLREWEKEEEDV